jgi:2-polyprenyl-3-methyl-5-hydroxy-6-metoxy-1,4-benzoquinol methylase
VRHFSERYERVGREYDALDYEHVRLDTGAAIEYAITTRYLRRYVPDGAMVVDVGVGVGHYSEGLARRGCMVHLIDVSQRLLDATASRLEDAGLGEHILSVQRASATDLSHLPDACCDVVLLLGPLYHLLTGDERRAAVAEAARLLRPGGLVFAAGVNTLTYLRDVMRGDPDDFGRRPAYFLDRLPRDGNLETPDGQAGTMHTTTVAAFRAELSPPFVEVVLAGVESFASKHEPEYLHTSPDTKMALLDLIERTATMPEGLGATSHYLFIGRSRGEMR